MCELKEQKKGAQEEAGTAMLEILETKAFHEATGLQVTIWHTPSYDLLMICKPRPHSDRPGLPGETVMDKGVFSLRP